MKLKPPDVKDTWDDCDVWTQSLIVAYSQIREIEEGQTMGNLFSVMGAR